MRLDFFILADNASAPDGKVYIHGGAITRVFPGAFPAATPLTAVTRLLVDSDELGGQPRTFALEWAAPDELSWHALGDVELVPQEPPWGVREGEDLAMVIVAGFGIAFPGPGSYRFRVTLEGQELAVRRVYVTTLDDPAHPSPPATQPPPPPDPTG